MPSAYSKEPDLDRAREIAERGCILRGLVGSVVHGLSNPGTDDRDEMGVCVEPREYVVGLRRFDHFVYRTRDEGESSGPGDLDLTIYGLRKYVRLAAKGSPTALLLLHVPESELVVRTPLGDRLRALAPAFVSGRTGRAFVGYVDSQRRGLLGGRGGSRDRELSSAHGYDTKYAMHALRIAIQGIELLTHGRITLPVPEPDRARLMEVRRGEIALEDVLDALHERSAQLERVLASAELPDEPDADAIDRFLVEAHEAAWRSSPGRGSIAPGS
jgi:uncharacterized protein